MSKIRHFIDTQEFSKEELLQIFDLMSTLKESRKQGAIPQLLRNKSLAMIFEEPSTRTRVSFETAMTLLGGHALYLKPGEIHLGVRESLFDTAKVLSRMADVIMARTLLHKTITDLAEFADVPVINGLTDYNHPTQVIADVFTMIEHMPFGKGLEDIKVVFIGDRTNVCSSLMHMTTKMGMHFTQIAPVKYQAPGEWVRIAESNIRENGGSLTITDNMNAVEDADFIYTDLWWWVDQEDEAEERVAAFKPTYQVTSAVMEMAGKQAKFMHCLPASRNVEVLDEVIDSPASIVFDEAENRLTAQMGLLVYLTFPTVRVGTKEEEEKYHEKIEQILNRELIMM
ncbi:putrescine carbamoyltransferase [Bacillus sp. JJ1764]|uniref:putrescine carbamoyltransferase n=1 Tax=Bacillus sp. JJ1764 TaxID=3122964 RepID=UPI002FFF33D9